MTSAERHEARYRRRKVKRMEHHKQKYSKYDDFNEIFTYEHLWESSKKCIRGVRWKSSVQSFISNRPLNLAIMLKKLNTNKYKIENTYEFTLYERGKKRNIRSVGIQERVVQHCLCDYSLLPMLKDRFIYDNGASLKGKGVQFTRQRLKNSLIEFNRNHSEGYILVFDFQKYFDSIPHDLILRIMNKYYTDQKVIDLVMKFVKFAKKDGVGIDLGSQISQIFALAAVNELDHFIKDELRVKYYARYMDDGYLICESKEQLFEYKKQIDKFVESLGLTLNQKKTMIVKLSKGFVFLKNRYRIVNGKLVITPTRASTVRMRRKLKKFVKMVENGRMSYKDVEASFQSWKSHLKGTKSFRVLNEMTKLYNRLYFYPLQNDNQRREKNNVLQGDTRWQYCRYDCGYYICENTSCA